MSVGVQSWTEPWQSACRWYSHKPHSVPTGCDYFLQFTFYAREHLCQLAVPNYIDSGTHMWTACSESLPNSGMAGYKTCDLL